MAGPDPVREQRGHVGSTKTPGSGGVKGGAGGSATKAKKRAVQGDSVANAEAKVAPGGELDESTKPAECWLRPDVLLLSAELAGMEVALLQAFAGLRTLKVQIAGPRGQSATQLSGAARSLRW